MTPRPQQGAAHLPGAESLEEEEEREAPDHGGADDAEQRDELDPLPAPELGVEGWGGGGVGGWRELPEGHSSPLSWPAQMRLVHYTAQPAPHKQLGSSPPMATLLGLPVPRTLCWWRPGQAALCAGLLSHWTAQTQWAPLLTPPSALKG